MNPEQLFVACTSIVLGVLAVAAGASNRDVFFQLAKMKWIESRGGRPLARATFAFIGVTLIGLGIAIAMGFAPNASAASSYGRLAPSQSHE